VTRAGQAAGVAEDGVRAARNFRFYGMANRSDCERLVCKSEIAHAGPGMMVSGINSGLIWANRTSDGGCVLERNAGHNAWKSAGCTHQDSQTEQSQLQEPFFI
jgi:hypothetical protein